MRTIGVVTVARSDYGIYLPLLRRIQEDSNLKLYLIAAGMHLSPEFGLTVKAIEVDGFKVDEKIEFLLSSDTPQGVAKSIGLGTIGFAQTFARFCPDILVVLGDRFEMYAAALAALPFKIPVAHIHGGEVTHGAIDDALRHSMTKFSHLHFVARQEYACRLVQLGEEPWRVIVSGALSLDNLNSIKLLKAHELQDQYKVCLKEPLLLATFHPVTLEYEQTEWQVNELLAALEVASFPIVFTLPNADTCSRVVLHRIQEFVQNHPSSQLMDNLGTQAYFSLMALASAMVGNSSSGIIEAPSFKLPVVNIGTRQQGRMKLMNVLDVGYEREEILEGIRKATDPHFRESLQKIENPYGSGRASAIIVERLKDTVLDNKLVIKHFHDIKNFDA